MKPKLLLVADTYYPKVDGTLRFMEEFIKRSKNTFDISLLVPDLGEEKKIDGVRSIHFLQTSRWIGISGYSSMKLSPKNFRIIKKAIKESDLIFVQGPAMISYLSIRIASHYKKKVVFYLHTLSWEIIANFFPPLLNKIFYRLAKIISVAFYNRCAEILLPYNDLGEELRKSGVKTSLKVARLGVDIERFSPAKNRSASKKKFDLDPEKIVIGYVGRVSKEKNTQVLYEAFRRLAVPEKAHLLIVGDGPKDQMESFRKLSNCTITGFVRNVEDYLRAMDIFVMPSLTETTSLATLEAMSCGLPVIATKVGFINYYLVKNHNGLFFPKNSPAMLAIKIDKLIKNENFRQNLGMQARKTIAYSFSWDRSINKIKRILLQGSLNL